MRQRTSLQTFLESRGFRPAIALTTYNMRWSRILSRGSRSLVQIFVGPTMPSGRFFWFLPSRLRRKRDKRLILFAFHDYRLLVCILSPSAWSKLLFCVLLTPVSGKKVLVIAHDLAPTDDGLKRNDTNPNQNGAQRHREWKTCTEYLLFITF